MTSLSKKKHRSFLLLLSIISIDNLALSIVYPLFTYAILIPSHSLLSLNTPLSTRIASLALLIALFPLAQLFGGPILSHLSKAKGEKYTLSFSLIGEIIGLITSAIAIKEKAYIMLLFGRFLSGFFAGNLLLCLLTIINLTTDSKGKVDRFKIVGKVTGGSFVIAILIGGILSNSTIDPIFSNALPFYCISFLCLVNLGCLYFFYKETKEEKRELPCSMKHYCRQIGEVIKRKKLTTLYCLFFFFLLGWIVTLQFLPTLLIEHFSSKKIVITAAFIGIGIIWFIISTYISSFFTSLLPLKSALLLSFLFFTFSLFLLTQTSSLLLFFPLIFFTTCFASLIWTYCLHAISIATEAALQGKAFLVTQSVATVSMTLAPLFGGLLSNYDVWTIYLFASFFSFLATLLLVIHTKLLKKIF